MARKKNMIPEPITLIVKDIRIIIEQGEFVTIYGVAGSGKSPILRDLSRDYPDRVCFLIRDDVPHVQHRINILKAVLGGHDIYLFDEPTGHGLVRAQRMEMLSLIHRLHDHGKTIIMATHDQAAIELGTRVIELMEDQTFIDHGPGLHRTL